MLDAPVTVDVYSFCGRCTLQTDAGLHNCTSLGALVEQLDFLQGEWRLLKYCLAIKNLHLGKVLGREQLILPISTHDAALRAVASRIMTDLV